MTDSPLSALDAQIAAKHLLTHPFYLAWTRGELTREALADYATQYYRHVAAFPTYLSALHSHCDDEETRKQVLQNLNDEEGGAPNHPALWRRFAQSLGVTQKQLQETPAQPETAHLVSTFREVCAGGSTAEGLAALYAYESQIPAVSETKIDGLKKFYGMRDAKSFEYFTVHMEADREHAAAERQMLSRYVNRENFGGVTETVERVLGALWALLSGVCRRHAIAM